MVTAARRLKTAAALEAAGAFARGIGPVPWAGIGLNGMFGAVPIGRAAW